MHNTFATGQNINPGVTITWFDGTCKINGTYCKVHTVDSLRYFFRSCRRRNLAPKSILLCSWAHFVRGKHGSRGHR